MVDISRMPDSAIFSVRGMGVADNVSVSTCLESSLSFSLCVTPKRCSSSMTSNPRSLKCSPFCSSECVPMSRSIFPSAALCKIFFFCAGVLKRESTSIVTGKLRKRLMAVA